MNKIKQNTDVLIDVCEAYDRNPEKRARLKDQILYLLSNINKQLKQNAK